MTDSIPLLDLSYAPLTDESDISPSTTAAPGAHTPISQPLHDNVNPVETPDSALTQKLVADIANSVRRITETHPLRTELMQLLMQLTPRNRDIIINQLPRLTRTTIPDLPTTAASALLIHLEASEARLQRLNTAPSEILTVLEQQHLALVNIFKGEQT